MLSINFKFVLPVLIAATVVKEATATSLLKPIKVCVLSGFTVAVTSQHNKVLLLLWIIWSCRLASQPCTCVRYLIPFILDAEAHLCHI